MFGTACRDVGTTVSTMEISPGYYRLSSASTDVRRCPDASANCSDAHECPETTSGCRGSTKGVGMQPMDFARRHLQASDDTTATSNGCQANLTGVFCRSCSHRSDGLRVYYSAANARQVAQCKGCYNSARDTILGALGVFVALVIAALLVVLIYCRCLPERQKHILRRAWLTFTPHVKLKILVGFYLIATKIDSVYEVELPPEVKRLLSGLSLAMSFGFSSVGTVLECLNMRGYVPCLAAYMVAPGAIALVILLVGLARLMLSGRRRRAITSAALLEWATPYLLQLLFLAYPLVTNAAFDAFSCYTFLESEWLKADVSIQCSTAKHERAMALAWVAIAIYPIGLLALVAALLLSARRAIVSQKPTALSRAIDFLHREYEPRFYWYNQK